MEVKLGRSVYDNPFVVSPRRLRFTSPSQGYGGWCRGVVVEVNTTGPTHYLLDPSNEPSYPSPRSVVLPIRVLPLGGFPRRIAEHGTHPDSKAVILTKSETVNPGQKPKQAMAVRPLGGIPTTMAIPSVKSNLKVTNLGGKWVLVRFIPLRMGVLHGNHLFPTNQPPPTYLLIEKAYFKSDTTGFFIARDPAYRIGALACTTFQEPPVQLIPIEFY